MIIEFFGGSLDGQKRDTDILYPGTSFLTDEEISRMSCTVKGDGTYRAKKVKINNKYKWMMVFCGEKKK